MLERIEKFNETRGVNFYLASRKSYVDMPEDIQECAIFSKEDVETLTEYEFDKLYNYLCDKYPVSSTKHVVAARLLHKIYKDTLGRCTGMKNHTTCGEEYLIMHSFIDVPQIKDVLCRNPKSCWNMFMIVNHKDLPIIRLCFKPSRSLLSRYKFIRPHYTGTRIDYFYVVRDEVENYEGRIYINIEEIELLHFGMYHPYVWGLIQNERYNDLKMN